MHTYQNYLPRALGLLILVRLQQVLQYPCRAQSGLRLWEADIEEPVQRRARARTVAADVAEDLGVIRRGAEVHRHLAADDSEPIRSDRRPPHHHQQLPLPPPLVAPTRAYYPDLAGREWRRAQWVRDRCVRACPRGVGRGGGTEGGSRRRVGPAAIPAGEERRATMPKGAGGRMPWAHTTSCSFVACT